MGDPAGYYWSIKARGADWVWSIQDTGGAVIASGTTFKRAHAAACVVRALVRAVTQVEPQALAA